MKNLRLLLAILGLALVLSPALAARAPSLPAVLAAQAQPSSSSAPAESPAPAATPQPPQKKVTAYTLPPETYKKARDLSRIHFRFNLISFVYGLIVLWIILRWKFAA